MLFIIVSIIGQSKEAPPAEGLLHFGLSAKKSSPHFFQKKNQCGLVFFGFASRLYTRCNMEVIMGYKTKIQLIKRQKGSDQYYVNFPGVLAEVLGVEKGEEVAWEIAEGGELVLDRPNKKKAQVVRLKAEKTSAEK